MDELERIMQAYYYGHLCTRQEALESIRKLDPALRAYRPAEYWLDGE